MTQPGIKCVVDHDAIIKSAEDKRQYRGLELNNGLKVLLISDPTTDESSAALDVHVGECRVEVGNTSCFLHTFFYFFIFLKMLLFPFRLSFPQLINIPRDMLVKA